MNEKVTKVNKKSFSVEELFDFVDKLQEKSKSDKSVRNIINTATKKWESRLNNCI